MLLRDAVAAVGAICKDGVATGSNLVRLKGDGARTVVSAFDGFRTAHAFASDAFRGTACVDARHLTRALAKLQAPTLKVADRRLTITGGAGGGKLTIPCHEHEVTAPLAVTGVNVPGPAMREAIKRVAPAMSLDTTRPHVNAILIERAGRAVATDGGCMAVCRAPDGIQMLLPASLVPLILATEGDVLTIASDERSIIIAGGDVIVGCPAMTQAFPPWQQVIPKTRKYTCAVTKAAILDAIAVAELSGENYARLESSGTELVVDAQDERSGADSVSAVPCAGALAETFVSTKLLADAVRFVAGDSVTIGAGSTLDPLMFTGTESADDAVAVVMPLNMAGRKARGGKR